jgi:hypothetical protein
VVAKVKRRSFQCLIQRTFSVSNAATGAVLLPEFSGGAIVPGNDRHVRPNRQLTLTGVTL